MTPSLSTRTALVTGSLQGIGFAAVLAGAGARLAVYGLGTPQQADDAVAAMREAGAADARFFEGDMRDPAAIDALMDAIAAWGGVDILVNNAGMAARGTGAPVSC